MKVALLTLTIGANPEYSKESFYKSQMDQDTLRVAGRFESAAAAGIDVRLQSLSWQELRKCVNGTRASLQQFVQTSQFLG